MANWRPWLHYSVHALYMHNATLLYYFTYGFPYFSFPAFSIPAFSTLCLCCFVQHFPFLHFPAMYFCATFPVSHSPPLQGPAGLCRIFQSCIFMPRIFSVPEPTRDVESFFSFPIVPVARNSVRKSCVLQQWSQSITDPAVLPQSGRNAERRRSRE